MKQNLIKNKAFSIIEVLIGIFIFSMGLMSVYMLIQSAININEDNKNRIIASNLRREGIELVRNIRDSNYKSIHLWNSINPKNTSDFENPANLIQTGVYYKISNNFNGVASDFPIKLEIISDFGEGKDFLDKMENYRLCLDDKNRYSYCDSSFTKKTIFYRYIKFEDLNYKDAGLDKTIDNGYKLTSKVFWYNKGLHNLEIKTIITDYKKL